MREETLIDAVNDIDTIARLTEDLYDKYYNNEPDYWEKLKHQYAGMAMQGIMSNKDLFNTITEGVWPPNRPAYIAARCDEYATTLVNRLKEDKL